MKFLIPIATSLFAYFYKSSLKKQKSKQIILNTKVDVYFEEVEHYHRFLKRFHYCQHKFKIIGKHLKAKPKPYISILTYDDFYREVKDYVELYQKNT